MASFKTEHYDDDLVSGREAEVRRLAHERMTEHYGGDGWLADDVDYDEALMYRHFWAEASGEIPIIDVSPEEAES